MTEHTAAVLMVALIMAWNVFLWTAFLFMVAYMSASYWILIIPFLFTVFPNGKTESI